MFSTPLPKAKVDAFMQKAFKKKWFADYYKNEWYERFDTPRRAWSMSDYDRRKILKKMFPEKFGGLDKDANLNNPEWQIPKYDRW